jgi:hypothetical protein
MSFCMTTSPEIQDVIKKCTSLNSSDVSFEISKALTKELFCLKQSLESKKNHSSAI